MATTPSSERIFDILRLICSSAQPLGVADIARAFDLAPSTAHRALSSLESAGFVGQIPSTSKWQPGPMAMRVAHGLFRRFPSYDMAVDTAGRLCQLTGETSAFSIRLGWYLLRIVAIPGNREVYRARRLGLAGLLHEGLAGLAVLGTLGRDTRTEYESFLKRHRLNSASVEVRVASRRLAAEKSPHGIVLEPSATGSGFASVGIPVRRADGEAVGAFTIEGRVVDLAHRGVRARLAALREIVAASEADLLKSAELATSPYAHIPIDTIRLERIE